MWLLLLFQAFVVLGVVEFLVRRMPRKLQELSQQNCFRLDGSLSRRRTAIERRATRKVRWDLLAVVLIIAFTGNWLLVTIHTQVIPLPLAARSMQLFDLDIENWKHNLRQAEVDAEYERWATGDAALSATDLRDRTMFVWRSWPSVVFFCGLWVVVSTLCLRRAYLKSLKEFAIGLQRRSEANINMDIGRLQAAAEDLHGYSPNPR